MPGGRTLRGYVHPTPGDTFLVVGDWLYLAAIDRIVRRSLPTPRDI